VLGLNLLASHDLTDEQKHLVTDRETARSNHDFAKADELRDELAKAHIELRDTPLGTIWSRTA
jgi:cysteinyl-tRNA synthetase